MSSKSTIKAFHTLALDNIKVTVNYVLLVWCKCTAGGEAVIDQVGVFKNPTFLDY